MNDGTDRPNSPAIRIGHGYDVHAFEEGDGLKMGGVGIPHDRGFKAHSDGDVLIHAVCDALLGALALGDIGRHFPDTDERYKNINSRELLLRVMALLNIEKYHVLNLDCTIVAQTPHMASHIDSMIENISSDMSVHRSQVNVKATTTENLGFAGRKEGIAVHAVVLISA